MMIRKLMHNNKLMHSIEIDMESLNKGRLKYSNRHGIIANAIA
jgi:hypothetical protein